MARAVLRGIAASPGFGVGRVLFVSEGMTAHAAGDAEAGTPARAVAGQPGARDDAVHPTAREGAAHPAARLELAFEASARELEGLASRLSLVGGGEIAAILEAQALMARDPALVQAALAAVAAGVPADDAVRAATSDRAAQLAALDDPYIRARAADVLDVGRRVSARLAGRETAELWHPDGTPAVIVADDLAPSATATLRRERIAGLALASGAITGHAAIVARALGLPLVLGLGAAVLAVAPESSVAVDGTAGLLIIDPDGEDVRSLGAQGEGVRDHPG